MERKFEIATRALCVRMSYDFYSRECEGTLGGGPLVRNVCESYKSLEGDCGMDKVPRCCFLTPFQEGTHNKSEKYKFCKQCD